MGIRNAGTIATFEGFTDLGALIRSELTSGNVSGGTYVRKKSARMRFQLQRGLTTSATAEPTFQWQCRDDGGLWQPLRSLSLGKIGQSDYIAQMERCGIYRERQHRIVFTDPTCQFVFVDVEETNTLLKD
jgi:hypothetical protein